jgi:hypothetical protein
MASRSFIAGFLTLAINLATCTGFFGLPLTALARADVSPQMSSSMANSLSCRPMSVAPDTDHAVAHPQASSSCANGEACLQGSHQQLMERAAFHGTVGEGMAALPVASDAGVNDASLALNDGGLFLAREEPLFASSTAYARETAKRE